jgi:hypothetical protein
MLKYLHEDVKAPWDCETANRAALNGHLHILKYLSEREYKYGARSCAAAAAERGQLECLKYLHEVAKARWTSSSIDRKSGNRVHVLSKVRKTPRMFEIPSRQQLPFTERCFSRTFVEICRDSPLRRYAASSKTSPFSSMSPQSFRNRESPWSHFFTSLLPHTFCTRFLPAREQDTHNLHTHTRAQARALSFPTGSACMSTSRER